ncbi:MAG TPA: Asp-tRNA(Asn)/Glu-tRNA(Gln) amidotransferase subunit GatB [Candidatus Dormibacteraeota bacterium]|nr:Asp-tRNA(Asn)/Glu-tRNA(Gln) amidotransferase subunit GatB [Candidatus Dormibacteraeota bacterium]
MSKYEAVIGIETHVQLATKSKLFCGCDNDSREAEPNVNICPVCAALPGSLPVLNGKAVELAIRAGLALNGEIPKQTKFDRKNYFYPDNPSNYQITQYDEPIVGKGKVELPGGKTVGVTRAHLEADAGKLVHPPGKDYSLVDLNRAGTPLMEIVSEPDMRTAGEAKAYAQELYHLMRYAGVSDCDLYYGNMRFDVNISLRLAGSKELGTRAEIKNLNSFRAVYGVVEYEAGRQAEVLDSGGKVEQETRGWNEDKQITFSQRSKEEAHDYRYFPEPDLPPIVVTDAMLAKAKAGLPDIMPNDVRSTLAELEVKKQDVEFLVEEALLAEKVFESRQHTQDPKRIIHIINWVANQFNDEFRGKTPDAKRLAQLADMFEDGIVSSTNAKNIFILMHEDSADPEELAEKHGYLQVSDEGELQTIVEQVIKNNPKPVQQYKSGDEKVLGFLVGQVMKESKGQANPPMVNDIIKKKLGDK